MVTIARRGIEQGDGRPRIFIEIEAAVHPSEIDLAAVDELHWWIVGRVEDWFEEDAGLNIVTFVEPSDADWT